MVDETRKEVKGRGIDLTSRLQLRDDCAAVENIIEKIRKGKFKQKDINGLEPANNPSADFVGGYFEKMNL